VKAPGTETDTYAVNNKGVMAGDYVDQNGAQHGMILSGANLTTADRSDCPPTPGANGIAFYGINSANVAVGWCTNTNGVEIGFGYANGKFRDIKIPNATGVQATGVNDSDKVVGCAPQKFYPNWQTSKAAELATVGC
jgi:hypothetical protein